MGLAGHCPQEQAGKPIPQGSCTTQGQSGLRSPRLPLLKAAVASGVAGLRSLLASLHVKETKCRENPGLKLCLSLLGATVGTNVLR